MEIIFCLLCINSSGWRPAEIMSWCGIHHPSISQLVV